MTNVAPAWTQHLLARANACCVVPHVCTCPPERHPAAVPPPSAHRYDCHMPLACTMTCPPMQTRHPHHWALAWQCPNHANTAAVRPAAMHHPGRVTDVPPRVHQCPPTRPPCPEMCPHDGTRHLRL